MHREEKIPNLLKRLAPLTFWSAFGHFGTHFAERFRMSKSSWKTGPTCSREMPSCPLIDLAEIQPSSKISLWIWSIISGVVTVLSRPGRGASQVEKLPRLNCATHFLTVEYDGTCSPNVCVNIANFLRHLALQEKKLVYSSRLDVAEIARVAWHNSFQPLWQEKTRNSVRERSPLSNDTVDSVLRHRELGQSKDLSAPPCTVVVKDVANFLGITFSGCSFYHQELVDGTVRCFTRIYIA